MAKRALVVQGAVGDTGPVEEVLQRFGFAPSVEVPSLDAAMITARESCPRRDARPTARFQGVIPTLSTPSPRWPNSSYADLMSFSANVTLSGMTFTPYDIVQFNATSLGPATSGSFSIYFNGPDVGMDASADRIDAMNVLPDGRILISTVGNPTVSGVSSPRAHAITHAASRAGTRAASMRKF